MHTLMRRSLIGFVVLASVLTQASAALARGDGWVKASDVDAEVTCGTTVLHLVSTGAMNKEYFRTTTLADGTVVIKVTGAFKLQVTNEETGATATYNASGPSAQGQLVLPNGDFEYISGGLNIVALSDLQVEETGLPQFFVSSGPIDILFTTDGGAQLISGPSAILHDICAELA